MNVIDISNIFRRLFFNMAREWWCLSRVSSWLLLYLTFILLGVILLILICSLFIFQHGEGVVVFKSHFFMMTFHNFWELWMWIKVNNFVSVDFRTHFSVWLLFLISMKFCTRIINKKGRRYENAMAPLLSNFPRWIHFLARSSSRTNTCVEI